MRWRRAGAVITYANHRGTEIMENARRFASESPKSEISVWPQCSPVASMLRAAVKLLLKVRVDARGRALSARSKVWRVFRATLAASMRRSLHASRRVR